MIQCCLYITPVRVGITQYQDDDIPGNGDYGHCVLDNTGFEENVAQDSGF